MSFTQGYSIGIRLVVGLLCLVSTIRLHAGTSNYLWKCTEGWTDFEGQIHFGERVTKDVPFGERVTKAPGPAAAPVPQDRVTRDAPMYVDPKQIPQDKPQIRVITVTAQGRVQELTVALQKKFPDSQATQSGAGGGGIVMRVTNPDGTSFVVKMARVPWHQHYVDMLKKDPVVYAKAKEADPEGAAHLVQVDGLIEVTTDFAPEIAVQMQYASEGSLASHLAEFGPGRAPLEVLNAWRQMALGLRAIHRGKMVHRDIHPENILVHKNADGSITYLVSDHGVALLPDEAPRPGTLTGTFSHMTKEARRGEPSGVANDIHGMRIVFMEMLMGHSVWNLDATNPANNVVIETVNKEAAPILLSLPYETSLKIDPRLRTIVEAHYRTVDEMIAGIDQAIALVQSNAPPGGGP